jgi:hypothetical protein
VGRIPACPDGRGPGSAGILTIVRKFANFEIACFVWIEFMWTNYAALIGKCFLQTETDKIQKLLKYMKVEGLLFLYEW